VSARWYLRLVHTSTHSACDPRFLTGSVLFFLMPNAESRIDVGGSSRPRRAHHGDDHASGFWLVASAAVCVSRWGASLGACSRGAALIPAVWLALGISSSAAVAPLLRVVPIHGACGCRNRVRFSSLPPFAQNDASRAIPRIHQPEASFAPAPFGSFMEPGLAGKAGASSFQGRADPRCHAALWVVFFMSLLGSLFPVELAADRAQ